MLCLLLPPLDPLLVFFLSHCLTMLPPPSPPPHLFPPLHTSSCSGMVESAFEFADICREEDYHNFVFSMKASNPLVMVQAYRLLAEEMYARGWDYPLHLGVTGGCHWSGWVGGCGCH